MTYGKTIVLAIAITLSLSVGAAYAKTDQPTTAKVEELTGSATPPSGAVPAKTADGNAPLDANATTQPAKGGTSMDYLPFIVLGLLLLLFIWSNKSKKKQENKHKQMLASLKKGDKVTSVGGIVGTIIEVRDDEIIMKVDETNNVRMRFARWAIRGVGEEVKKQAPEENK